LDIYVYMANMLLERCKEFERLTKISISLHENTDPILKKLSDLEEFDDRVEFAEKHWEKLGEGSSRCVFKINEHLIIKIAINDRGIAQNHSEMNLDLQKPCITETIVADGMGKWLITHFTNNITEKEFKEIMGFTFDQFSKSLLYAFNNEDNVKEPKEYDTIKKNPFFNCVSKAIIDGSLLVGDLEKISSYGAKNGTIYLRDTGFTKQVYDDYYSDKDSD
jgi:hypothetical protein